MKKILFLEDKSYYQDLGILEKVDNNKNYTLEFNGIRKYKISIEKLKKYHCVVSLFYTNPVSNFIIIKAKQQNIKTILISDGVFDFSNAFNNRMQLKYGLKLFHPIIHDIFLSVGKQEKNYFGKGVRAIQFLPKKVINTKVRIPLPNVNKILITTANTAYFNETEKELLISILKRIIQELDSKGHQYFFRIFDENIINALNVKPINNQVEGSFEQALANADYVITTPSSISINAMYHNRPVAHLQYRDLPIYLQSAWVISGSYPIGKTIKSMLEKEEDRLKIQNNILEQYLVQNTPSEVFEDAIHSEIINSRNNDIDIFVNKNLKNMLESRLNFNLEYLARRLYKGLKKKKIFRKLRYKIK
ncbi:hypothetical protein [Bacillus sp. P14.5]|uniref:hypothetical protein n=1 Tax=Bacillus sp. P14.5 TaxID=1983400 RepID=UPI000DEB90E6|nr:hypothetical protein [Bacillus sp. P14.5]